MCWLKVRLSSNTTVSNLLTCVHTYITCTYLIIYLFICLLLWFVECWQVYKSALPSHTVYTLNMERILNRMTHPSHEELEHDEIYRQEVNLKRELNNRQRLLCAETDIAM